MEVSIIYHILNYFYTNHFSHFSRVFARLMEFQKNYALFCFRFSFANFHFAFALGD